MGLSFERPMILDTAEYGMAFQSKTGRFSTVKQSLLPVTLSALLLALIFPGFSYAYLAWIAFAPLFLLIFRSGYQTAIVSAFVTGAIFYLCMLHWVIRIEDANLYNFVVIIVFFSSFFALFAALAKFFQLRLPGWEAITFPSLWVSIEYLKTHIGFFSFPQGVIGYSQYKVLTVAQIAEYTGVYGVSFAIVAVNAALASIVSASQTDGFRWRFGAGGVSWLNQGMILLVLSIIIVQGVLSRKVKFEDKSINVALIQGNDVANKKNGGNEKYAREILPIYEKLTTQAAHSGAKLVIWPSSSVPGRLPVDLLAAKHISNIAMKSGSYLLVGAYGVDKLNHKQMASQQTSTSAFLFAPRGNLVGRYDKIHLLPFDEYVPLRDYISWPSWIVSPDKVDNYPGKKLSLFQAGDVRFGVQICFDNMFPDQIRTLVSDGAEFIVAQTNEIWAKSFAGQYQNLTFNVFRAIENRIPVLRSSTNGISCVIDAGGRIVTSVKNADGKEVNVSGMILAKIGISKRRTFYNRFGDLFALAILCLISAAGIFCIFSKPVCET